MRNKREFYKNSSLLKSPPIRKLTTEETNTLLNKYHYLGEVRGVLFAYGHNEGCLVFTNCRSKIYEMKLKNKGIKVIELARMVGKDGHNWSMSSLTSLVIKKIKKKL